MAGITAGEPLGGLTNRFDASGWASHSVLVNCVDILFAVPIFYSIVILLNAMTVTNPWSERFKKLVVRFKSQFWHIVFLMTF